VDSEGRKRGVAAVWYQKKERHTFEASLVVRFVQSGHRFEGIGSLSAGGTLRVRHGAKSEKRIEKKSEVVVFVGEGIPVQQKRFGRGLVAAKTEGGQFFHWTDLDAILPKREISRDAANGSADLCTDYVRISRFLVPVFSLLRDLRASCANKERAS
jgi:hypothetical protein